MDRFFNNNLVLRIVAIVLACILWFSVNAPQTTSTGQAANGVKDFPYAVQVTVPQDMIVTQIDHPTVVIEVKGSLLDSSSLPQAMMGVQVVANANGLGPGTHSVVLQAQNMPAAQYSIIPQSVQVTLEKKVTATKPIHIHVTGTPAKGYQVGKIEPQVQTVQVSGVGSAVSRVVAVTADISVANARTAVSHTLTLEPVDKNGTPVAGVEVDPVNVTTVVQVEPPQVAIHLTPEIFGSPAPGYAVAGVSLSQSQVNVTAPPDVMATLTGINVPVDVSGLRTSQILTVPIEPQSGWSHIDPSSVQASVTLEKSAARTFTNVPIQIRNIPPGLQVNLGNITNLDVRVSGPASIIAKLQPSNVVAYVDASTLSTNDTGSAVTVSVPNWITVTQLSHTSVPLSVQNANTGNSTTQQSNQVTNGTNTIG